MRTARFYVWDYLYVTGNCLVEIHMHHMNLFQVLLGSELIKSSSEERSLLKNLGSWLGKITIGRNQVLRAREIDPKSLIIEVLLIGSSWSYYTLLFFIFLHLSI
jgi:hypothetical protein